MKHNFEKRLEHNFEKHYEPICEYIETEILEDTTHCGTYTGTGRPIHGELLTFIMVVC